jgi:HAD superfamily hydrolase (TIGR01450 family)
MIDQNRTGDKGHVASPLANRWRRGTLPTPLATFASTPLRYTTIDQLLPQYDGLLLDAFGVLMNQRGPLPGAIELINLLNRHQFPYCIISNSASRTPAAIAYAFDAMGLAIAADRIISSGQAIAQQLAQPALKDRAVALLGPTESLPLLAPHQRTDIAEAEIFILADQKGYDLLPTLDRLISRLLARSRADLRSDIIHCNPDLIYPVEHDQVGITSGAIAAMIETILQRHGARQPQWHILGKPEPLLFEMAIAQLDSHRLLMVGDQLATDIAGAARLGLDSALVLTGLDCPNAAPPFPSPTPTWLLRDLHLTFN